MEVAILSNALGNMLSEIMKQLGSLVFQELQLSRNVGQEVEKLKNTVSTVRAVLQDADEQQVLNNQDKNWLEKLEDALYDAEDLLDDISTEAFRQQMMNSSSVKGKGKVRSFFCCSSNSNNFGYEIGMGHQIKKIRERLNFLSEDRRNFNWVGCSISTSLIAKARDQTMSFAYEEEVIGRDEDKKIIVQLLLDSGIDGEENVAILPIVGMGGLGKTTLAQIVFNDPTVVGHFELKLWVCVSDLFHIKAIVEKIVKSGMGRDLGNLEFDELQRMLREKIHGKKYLLVLDDVWSDDLKKWLELRKLLIGGAKGSRIVVTTRSEKVAKITSKLQSYKLGGLSKDDSRRLFIRIVFSGEEPRFSSSVVEKVGKEVVKRCSGIPLAIKTTASLLYFKDPEVEWVPFLENEFSKLSQDEDDIIPKLKLSYDHLPNHLKHCFAFCKIFPKDHNINVNMLIQLWIAEGFIKSLSPNLHLEETGLEYFKDLWWRSFFQEVRKDELGNIYECKMHDLMHDLATQVGGEETIVISAISQGENINEKTRHISFTVPSSHLFTSDLLKARKLGTLLWLGGLRSEVINLDGIVNHMKRLVVLDLHQSDFETVPDAISRLKHLRYVDLSYNRKIKRLPGSMAKLLNLVVLKLECCTALEEIPTNVNKLVNLKHLDLRHCHNLKYMPHRLGELTSIEKLTEFVVAKDDNKSGNMGGLNELNGLNNLGGSLSIRNLGWVRNGISEFEAANLKQKEHLHSLTLSWRDTHYNNDVSVDVDNYYEEQSLQSLHPPPSIRFLSINGYRGVRFPGWLSSLTNVVSLSLKYCNRCKDLLPLNQLPHLQSLWIYKFNDLEYIDNDESSMNWMDSQKLGDVGTFPPPKTSTAPFFPSLKELTLWGCQNLKGWRRRKDHHQLLQFPCLSSLRIRNCHNLCWMPLCPTLDGTLLLQGVSKGMVQDLFMEMMATATPSESSSSSSSSSIHPLSKLKQLIIDDIETLPTEGWQNLSSLQQLDIYGLPIFNLFTSEDALPKLLTKIVSR